MDLKAIAEAYQDVYEKKLDPVGKEDGMSITMARKIAQILIS